MSAVDDLRRSVEAELHTETPVLIELAGLDFCDVRGGALLVGLAEASAKGRTSEVELHGARGQVLDLLRRVGWVDNDEGAALGRPLARSDENQSADRV